MQMVSIEIELYYDNVVVRAKRVFISRIDMGDRATQLRAKQSLTPQGVTRSEALSIMR